MKNTLLFFFAGLLTFQAQTLALQSFGTGFTQPLEIANAGDTRLFIVEKTGRIKILNANGTVNATPFLDLSTLVTTDSERGLLGLAFHPNYSTNGLFFVNYTNLAGNTIIAKFTVDLVNSPNEVITSGSQIITITQPFSNHNGGSIKFGPDGYLYIGMGDGGNSGDPGNRSQNINENLGKMLRIDVNSATYINPASNPYIGIAGNDEIWAIGLRNPWKFSFNRLNGDLWIADVGQNAAEEVNKVTNPLTAGLNFGWRCYEGNLAYNTSGCIAQSATYTPIAVPTHANGNCSITGGYVYTGTIYPNMQNKYFFTDYCNGRIGIINTAGNLTYSADFGGSFVTFGETNLGELLIGDISNGTIYKIIDTSLSLPDFSNSDFKIYPNPSNQEVFIEKTSQNFPVLAIVFDINGKKLLEQNTQNLNKNSINITSLSKGFYVLKIKDNLERTGTYKLIVE